MGRLGDPWITEGWNGVDVARGDSSRLRTVWLAQMGAAPTLAAPSGVLRLHATSLVFTRLTLQALCGECGAQAPLQLQQAGQETEECPCCVDTLRLRKSRWRLRLSCVALAGDGTGEAQLFAAGVAARQLLCVGAEDAGELCVTARRVGGALLSRKGSWVENELEASDEEDRECWTKLRALAKRAEQGAADAGLLLFCERASPVAGGDEWQLNPLRAFGLPLLVRAKDAPFPVSLSLASGTTQTFAFPRPALRVLAAQPVRAAAEASRLLTELAA
jgi:hypothetical protein